MRKILLAFFLLAVFSCEAAAPITHAYLAKKFFKAYPDFSAEERNAFMVGTLFPDIRYISDNARENTHYEDVSLDDVIHEENPFIAGIKFHCYVDEQREQYVVENQIYAKTIPYSSDFYFTYLKLAEDELLFDKYNWYDVCLALQTIYPEELNWGIQEKIVVKWHKLLTLVFVNPPTSLLNTCALCNQGMLGVSAPEVKVWNRTLPQTCKSDWIHNYLNGLMSHFDHLLNDGNDEL